MFVDEVVIKVIAGKGGDGCTSFRREKYVPNGGPNGGNGGRGASIIFKVDEGLKTLLDLKYQKEIKGKKGENGKGSNMNGKAAEDVIIKVPLGTVVKDLDTNLIIADLTKKNDEVVVATGGRGGRGNTAFKTHSNTAPNFSENGEPGEEKTLKIELKLLADVGLVGLPSVGKSTLLSKISSAKPKIASYHFTTLVPNLVVKTKDNRTFVVADLPGLIEGAAEGTGLGDKFLRHIERTKLIVHIVDMSGIEGRDPYEDYEVIRKELKEYSEKLANKEEIVVANKMDMPSSIDNLKEFKKKIDKEVIEISGLTGAGIDDLLLLVADKLDSIEETNLYEDDEIESHILYKFKEEQPFTIEVDEDGVYVIHSESIEKLFKMTKFTDEGMRRFSNKLRRMGVDEELQKMGIEEGDIVRILDYEFEYTE